MNKRERDAVATIQDLIGRAIGEHRNDRNPKHMEAVGEPLEQAFNLCVEILGKYPPQKTAGAGSSKKS